MNQARITQVLQLVAKVEDEGRTKISASVSTRQSFSPGREFSAQLQRETEKRVVAENERPRPPPPLPRSF